jgi:hypothetical protein
MTRDANWLLKKAGLRERSVTRLNETRIITGIIN